MNFEDYMNGIKVQILANLKNITITQLADGLSKNESFIKACFDSGFSINHVVHELTL